MSLYEEINDTTYGAREDIQDVPKKWIDSVSDVSALPTKGKVKLSLDGLLSCKSGVESVPLTVYKLF